MTELKFANYNVGYPTGAAGNQLRLVMSLLFPPRKA
jgi:hypothetical protein